MRLERNIASMGEMRKVHKILVENVRSLGRPKSRFEENIKMVPQEMGCKGVD
jgi:hypothetical protein